MSILELNKICNNIIYFNFFGLKTKVNVMTKSDINLLKFQYLTFIKNPFRKPDIEFYFLTNHVDFGFFDALFKKKKEIKKFIYYTQNGKLHLYNCFTSWSDKTTPFPPFIFEPLVSKYIYLQGSSFVYNKSAYSFLGKPFNGKSTLVNWMLKYLKNSKYLADDITIINKDSFEVEPYHTASGIREDANKWFKKITNKQSNVTTISEITGKVEYHRIEDLYNNCLGKKSIIKTFFILENSYDYSKSFSLKKIINNKIKYLQKYRLPINDFDINTFNNKEINIYRLKYNLQEVDQNRLMIKIKQILIKTSTN